MPEFPLSRPDLKGTVAPREYRGRSGQDFEGAKHWRLVQVSYYANLQPSQIVREMDAPDRGWDQDPATGDAHPPRSERQDATADADRQRENTDLVTVDERRYVVDPIVEGHTFKGLWTGGPVQHYVAKDNHKYLRQTLTRTWCAGHGYVVTKDGAYVAKYPTAFDSSTPPVPTAWTETTPTGYGGVHGTSGNNDSRNHEQDTNATVREYRSAEDCLKACRPWMDGRLSPYMAFRTDIPASYTREVYWREFTHESVEPLEELGSDVEKLKAVVAYHFGDKVGGTVMDAHTRLDPQTNTVIFVCNLLYRDLKEITKLDDLLDAPCIDAPCTRETLRMFGWGQLRNGEGYEYTHAFRWPCLKDSDDTRRVLEFLKDNEAVGTSPDTSTFLLKLLDKHYHPQLSQGATKPDGWWAGYETAKSVVLESMSSGAGHSAQLDNTDRLVTSADVGPVTSGTAATAGVQHYRIAKQNVEVEQDGSLTFTIAIAKAEWHGYDSGTNYESGGTRQLASIQNPGAWGESEHRVIPSVPRENAISTMNAITAGAHEIISQKNQSEGQKGSSDVSFVREKTFDYNEAKPDGVKNPFGPEFDAPGQNLDPYPRKTYSLTYERVEPNAVGAVIAKAKNLLSGDDAKVSVQYHPGGYYTVRVTGTDKEPRHIEEWVVEADWFHHKTVEQWLGVKVEDVGGQKGFYFGTQTVNGTESRKFYSINGLRGDLDAGWMGAVPQSGTFELDYTSGLGDASVAVDPQPDHGDVHVTSGWSGSAWTDPDTSTDSNDKGRSHVKTSVRPHVNDDGTWNFTVERIYPHQRVWEWESEKNNGKKSGDWKTVYHIEYRNWPSRKAIHQDLVDRWAKLKGVDLDSDDYTYSFTPNVNQFGLVDAANVTIEPLFWPSDGRGKNGEDGTVTDASRYRFHRFGGRPMKARISPESADSCPAFAPMLGYYFIVQKMPHYYGTGYTTREDRDAAVSGIAEGGLTVKEYNGSGNFGFEAEGDWVDGSVVYMGLPPVPAQDASKTTVSQHSKGIAHITGAILPGNLPRATWERWYTGGAAGGNT